MTMRFAILAACASTLILAQPDFARASYGATSESKGPVRSTDVGPEPAIRLAQNSSEVIPGIDVVVCPTCGNRNPNFGQPNKKIGNARGTLPNGKARRGSKISDNESPRPTNRTILVNQGTRTWSKVRRAAGRAIPSRAVREETGSIAVREETGWMPTGGKKQAALLLILARVAQINREKLSRGRAFSRIQLEGCGADRMNSALSATRPLCFRQRSENTMTMRFAILAACAGTLTLAATTAAFAQSSHQRIPGSDIGAFEGRAAPGKLQRRETGSGTAQPSISDQGAAGN